MENAFVFPGQGSQAVGMGLSLSEAFPAARMVFEEVDDVGQEQIGSRQVVSQKEETEGQKAKVKGRLGAKGFPEEELPQYVRSQLPQRDLATQMFQLLQSH